MPRGLGPRGFLTDEEKKNRPKVTKSLILRILSYLVPYWPQFLLVFAAILLSAAVGLLPSIITGRIVDEALLGRDMELLVRLLAMAFVTLAASQVIGVLESYINAWISQRIIFDMKNQMYDHLQHMPHAFFTSEKQGDIITRMNTDISGVSTVISGTLSSIVSNFATVATTLAALFSMSWQLAIVGIVVIPLLILPSRSVGKTRWQVASESQRKNDEMNQLVNETLSVSGSLLVKLFTREEREYRRFRTVNEEVSRLAMKEQRSGKWFRVVMGMFTQLGPLLIYFAGGWLIISHMDETLTVGAKWGIMSRRGDGYGAAGSLRQGGPSPGQNAGARSRPAEGRARRILARVRRVDRERQRRIADSAAGPRPAELARGLVRIGGRVAGGRRDPRGGRDPGDP